MISPRHALLRATPRLLVAVPLLCACLVLHVRAQDDPRALDPADVFFQAWLEVKRAEKLEDEGKFSESWEKYRQAANYYDVLSKFHKNWKPHLVQSRVLSTRESIEQVKPKATAELAGKKMKTRDLIEGSSDPPPPVGKTPAPALAKETQARSASGYERSPGTAIQPTSQAIPQTIPQTIPRTVPQTKFNPSPDNSRDSRSQLAAPTVPDPRLTAKLQQLERENRDLKRELENNRAAIHSANKASQSARSTIEANTAEQKRLTDLISKKQRELEMLRDVLARAPLKQDMDRLTREKQTRERELEITARAYKASQQKLEEAQKMAAQHRAEAELAESRVEKIEKNMQLQGEVNNRVIRELRKELKAVTSLLEDSRKQLGDANARITQMQRSLEQSQTTIQELTKQRDNLRIERDTLANTLKKNDSKGVQNLITENMRLGRELKEALDRLSFLETNHNTTKDELLKARNDLAIAKTRIIRYQKEQADHGLTVRSLEGQLRDAQKALTNATATANAKAKANAHSNTGPGKNSSQEEIELLRATVKRLLAAQERRRMGEQILWETYQKSQVKIDGLAKAIEDIRKIKIDLSDEEKKFVTTHRRPDMEFSNPERVPLAHAQAHADALEAEVNYVEGLIIRHVEKGRWLPAHSVLVDINERFPGNYRILCKLGVVELKMGNYENAIQCLDEAITMRENSGYAHYMLGVAFYKNNKLDSARNALERSLDIKPENAHAHLYLGNLAGAAKRYQQAEKHFLSTVKLNPTLPDAYYNLSVLYLQQNRMKDALDYYHKALHHGAQPDQTHEKRLRS